MIMSQNDSYYQVQRVTVVRKPTFMETIASIAKNIAQTAPAQVVNNISAIVQPQISKPVTAPSSTILQSPVMLRPILQKQFNNNITTLNSKLAKQSDPVAIIQTAGLMTIQQSNLQVENREVVEKSIQNLMSASTVQQAKDNLTTMFSTLKEQHTKVFTNTLSVAIQTASATIGFVNIKSETVSSQLTRIVATNAKGVNLISEIHTDEKKKIDIVSELEGVTDGSCEQTMNAFNKALENMGIAAERKDRKPTGGIPVMEYAKNLNRKRNKRRIVYEDEQIINDREQNRIYQHINN